METDLSSIICVADMNVTPALDQCLVDLALPEVFVQPAKQMSLVDKQQFFGLRSVTKLEESRALIYRIFVPSVYEGGVMQRIAEATDLKMGGRGCIFSQRISFHRGTPLHFDIDKLEQLCKKTPKNPPQEHALISCTVSRGSGSALVQAVLELGVCVPIIFFGFGVGLRDKLGLLRITIPVEKEIIWFLVPRSDADLVDKNLIPRARLDVPGQGFLYNTFIHAPVVNLRVRHGKRLHAATMEQVIAALDEVNGSSDWRRLGSRKSKSAANEMKSVNTCGLFFIGEEEEVETFRGMAIASGARGATLNALEMRSYSVSEGEQDMGSHSRQLCDIITSSETEAKILNALAQSDLFNSKSTCILKTFSVETLSVIRSFVSAGGKS